MRESLTQEQAIRDLRTMFGCECHKLGQNGDPDWIVVYAPERSLYLEFKTDVGGLTRAQKVRFKELLERGHTIILARDYDTAIRAVTMAQKGGASARRVTMAHVA